MFNSIFIDKELVTKVLLETSWCPLIAFFRTFLSSILVKEILIYSIRLWYAVHERVSS